MESVTTPRAVSAVYVTWATDPLRMAGLAEVATINDIKCMHYSWYFSDINECQDEVESRCENGLCERKCENGWCINTAGSFRCQCDSGYKLGKYGKSCIGNGYQPTLNACFRILITADINECELVDILCENGECVNTEGGFHCECDTGYKPGEDGTSCEGSGYTAVCRHAGGLTTVFVDCIIQLQMSVRMATCVPQVKSV